MTARDGNETTDVVEMDAIDIDEWDRDRHTPRAHDTNLAELVRQSAAVETVPDPVIKSLLKTATAHTTRSQRAPSTTLPTPTPVQQTLVQTSRETPKARPPTLDDSWEDKPAAAAPPLPRTKTSPNTMRRTGPVPAQDPPKHKTQAYPAVAAPPTKPVPPALQPVTKASPKPSKPIEAPKPAKPPAQPAPKQTAATKPVEPPKPQVVVTKPVEPPKPVVATKPPKPIAMAAPEPPVRPSEPEMLPPPPAIAPAEDWDDWNTKTPVPKPSMRADPSDFDASREPSVVIDLNAVPKPAAGAKRVQTNPVMQTSEQSTTTSGAFVMPAASTPISASPPVITPPSSVWDRPMAAAVARHTPAPEALEASVPQPIAHVEATERRIVPRSILETVFPTPRKRRTAIIACASAAVLVIILVVALGGHRTSETQVAVAAPPAPTVAPAQTARPVAPAHAATAAATASVAPTPRVEPPTPPRKAPARRIVPRRKPVVVDYDKKPATTVADQDQSLAHARVVYAEGNQHLFAGDAAAAIASYHQALVIYPNYVAGYRGLGLAYSQQGDTTAALKAFKTYVKLAPAAKDVALIAKRIARLSAR